jgi:hypothetical protein
MALDSSEALGSQQLNGTRVTKRGFSTGMGRSVYAGDPISTAITRGIMRKKSAGQKATAADSTAPEFGTVGYLALTTDELALFKVGVKKSGIGNVLGELVTRIPRARVTTAEFDSAAMFGSGVTINFDDGQIWVLEAPRQDRKKAQELVASLAS